MGGGLRKNAAANPAASSLRAPPDPGVSRAEDGEGRGGSLKPLIDVNQIKQLCLQERADVLPTSSPQERIKADLITSSQLSLSERVEGIIRTYLKSSFQKESTS